jgi:hypothetical protein
MDRFAVHRVAQVRLRGRAGSVRAYWPVPTAATPALLVFFAGTDTLCRALCSRVPAVVLSAVEPVGFHDATMAVEWAAEHAAELGAEPRRLLVGGTGHGATVAAAVARHARDLGWPPVTVITAEDLLESLVRKGKS